MAQDGRDFWGAWARFDTFAGGSPAREAQVGEGPQAAAIELQGIDKSFGAVHANRAVDLRVERGTIYGFVFLLPGDPAPTIFCVIRCPKTTG